MGRHRVRGDLRRRVPRDEQQCRGDAETPEDDRGPPHAGTWAAGPEGVLDPPLRAIRRSTRLSPHEQSTMSHAGLGTPAMYGTNMKIGQCQR